MSTIYYLRDKEFCEDDYFYCEVVEERRDIDKEFYGFKILKLKNPMDDNFIGGINLLANIENFWEEVRYNEEKFREGLEIVAEYLELELIED